MSKEEKTFFQFLEVGDRFQKLTADNGPSGPVYEKVSQVTAVNVVSGEKENFPQVFDVLKPPAESETGK